MHLHTLDYVLWVAAPLLQGLTLIVLLRRGLTSQLPFFFGYMLYQVISDVCLLVVGLMSYTVYYYAYWGGVLLTILFILLLIDELFRLSFRNFTALRSLGTRIFRWAAALVLFLEVVSFPDVHGLSLGDVMRRILMVDRSARIILCSLAILLLFGAGFLRISTRSIVFGIALGFAFYLSSRALVESAFLNQIASQKLLVRSNSIAYLATCLLWFGYAARGNPLPEPVSVDHEVWDHTDDRGETPQQTLLEVINAVVERSLEKEHQNS